MLAGHSVGGTYALVHAARYPKQVAGVALIDSSTPHMFDLPDYPSFYSMWRRGSAMLPTLARTGLGRVTRATGSAGLPSQARDAARDFASSPRELRSNRNGFLMLPTVFDQARITSLSGKPLAVLTAGSGTQHGWTAAQSELAQLSTNSIHRTEPDATHAELLEDRRFAALPPRSFVTSSETRDDRIVPATAANSERSSGRPTEPALAGVAANGVASHTESASEPHSRSAAAVRA